MIIQGCLLVDTKRTADADHDACSDESKDTRKKTNEVGYSDAQHRNIKDIGLIVAQSN